MREKDVLEAIAMDLNTLQDSFYELGNDMPAEELAAYVAGRIYAATSIIYKLKLMKKLDYREFESIEVNETNMEDSLNTAISLIESYTEDY